MEISLEYRLHLEKVLEKLQFELKHGEEDKSSCCWEESSSLEVTKCIKKKKRESVTKSDKKGKE